MEGILVGSEEPGGNIVDAVLEYPGHIFDYWRVKKTASSLIECAVGFFGKG
jgi:hypothetical protein